MDESVLPENPYAHGEVYRIVCDTTGEVYIGSTVSELSHRLKCHFSDAKSRPGLSRLLELMREHEANVFRIELLEACPCEALEELRAKEGEWVRRQETPLNL